MKTWIWILIIAAVVVVGLLAMAAMQRRRSVALRRNFGPEYERTLQGRDNRRAAEADLRTREKQRAKLELTPIPSSARARFAQEWATVQEQFVDQPSTAVIAADDLLHRVMAARGYPMDNFEAQADLVSVDHPQVVQNYRTAHATYDRAQTQQASTEDLRQALVSYRTLFDDMLRSDEGAEVGPPFGPDSGIAPAPRQAGQGYAGSAPNYSAPNYSAPNYSAPNYSAPNYSAPNDSAPNGAAPAWQPDPAAGYREYPTEGSAR